VEVDCGGVVAHFLDCFFELDGFAVDVVAELFEGFCNLDGVDRAEDSACSAGLCADGEAYAFECGCERFGVGFDFCGLVGATTSSRRSGDNGFTLRDEVVAAVSVLYFHDVVLVSKALYVFFENNLHMESFSLVYFIKSVT